MASPLLRRASRLALRIVGVLLASALLFEGTVRFLIFSDAAASLGIARTLRNPWRFADPCEDAFWRLQHAFEADPIAVPEYDAELGWVGSRIEPGTYRPLDEEHRRGRRPILLYGDSFSQCTTPQEDCFQGWLERSPRAAEYALLNLGVGGYGLDQTGMLLERSIDHYAAERPLVLVGLLVDDDIDRCALGFRCWPKPRLDAIDGQLIGNDELVPPLEEYLADNPIGIRSYAWRLCLFGTSWAPAKWKRRVSEAGPTLQRKVRVGKQMLAEIHWALESRGMCHVFVLFYSELAMRDPRRVSGQQQLISRTLQELGASSVSMRAALLADAEANGRDLRVYFDPATDAHPSALGNQVMLAAMLAALERTCGM